MSSLNSGLPDLRIWDSIRDCANRALAKLVGLIEAEISKDQTLLDLRKTGSVRMALESRARDWMIRAYSCCLRCWQSQQREESLEFRTAVYYFGLSPFFSKQTLRLLRLAAGVSEEAISRLQTDPKGYFGMADRTALHDASEVYTKLHLTWIKALPPVEQKVIADQPQVRTEAPPSRPEQCASAGIVPSEPKRVELPGIFPPVFPRSLVLKARVIIADTVKECPERSKMDTLCKVLVSRCTDLLCMAVRAAILEAHAAPDQLYTILDWLLVPNCENNEERFKIERAVTNSDEWHAMLRKLLECDEELARSDAKGKISTQNGMSNRDRVQAFIENMQSHGHHVTKTDIWRVAGYRDATEFQRFQRDDERTTPGSEGKFDRILKLTPQEFIQRLQKLGSK
jgi:hypothetical protein